MSRSNREVYPITASVEDVIDAQVGENVGNRQVTIRQVADHLAVLVGEYEHGSADVEDVDGSLTLQSYAEVIKDLILYLANVPAGDG